MPDVKKVIKGLEYCMIDQKLSSCPEECPYHGQSDEIEFCNEKLIKDAYMLLKPQEPRVMTLDEVKNLQSLRDGAVWFEVLSGLFPTLPEFCMSNITFFVAIPFDSYRGYFDNEYYRKTWRCWTAKPTDKQRKAVKWDV